MRLTFRMLCCAAFLAICLFTAHVVDAGSDGPSRDDVLSFEFSIKLPGAPVSFGWSPDGKRLAVSQWNTGVVRLIDVERQLLEDAVLPAASPTPGIAWSPDGKYVALNETGRSNGIKLLRTGDWSITATRDRLGSPPCVLASDAGFAFTSDSKALWVNCQYSGLKSPTYVSAIKLELPTLELIGQAEVSSPLASQSLQTWQGTTLTTSSGLELTTLITMWDMDAPRINFWEVPRTYFARTIKVWAGNSAPEDVNLIRIQHYMRSPNKALAWPERGLLIVFWNSPESPLTKDDESVDKWSFPSIEVYEIASGKRLSSYAYPRELTKGALHDVVLARRRGVVIGGESRLTKAEAELAVWDAATGKLIQKVPSQRASWIGLSPNEDRLAVVGLDQVSIFKVH